MTLPTPIPQTVMPNWIPLTQDDLTAELSPAQAEAMNARPNADTADDPLDAALSDAVGRIRADIRSHAANQLSPDETRIPPELRGTGVLLALHLVIRRVPLLYLSTSQANAIEQALTDLERIRGGTLAVTPPDDLPAPQTALKNVTLPRHRSDRLSASRLAGL